MAAVRRAGHEPAPRPRRPASCRRKAAASTPSARPGTRATRPSPALRPTDPALLHYRSGAFYFARAQQVPGRHRSATCCGSGGAGRRADRRRPAQGVRAPDLAVIPQTSTIASHLPRAVGLAVGAAPRVPARRGLPRGPRTRSWSARFGDASVNHSTAAGAINTALLRRPRGLPVPCCSSARTTASASACRPRPAGSRRVRVPAGAPLRRRRRGDPVTAAGLDGAGGRTGSASSAGPPSCTCGPCGSWATPAATRRSPTGGRGRSPPTSPATRCWLPPAAGRRGRPAGRDAGPLRRDPRRDRRRGGAADRRPQAALAAEVVAPLAPRRPDRGGRGRRGLRGPSPSPGRARGPWPSRSTRPSTDLCRRPPGDRVRRGRGARAACTG